jgi:cysteinyl-tRNA synthetase
MKIYNTLTRKKEDFKPIEDKKVGLYTCGPTVYNYAHLGNLRTYIFEDILRRVLEFEGFKVNHVMNITDVGHLTSDADTGEDKVEMESRKEGKSAKEIASFYTEKFKKDLKRLNILKPRIWAKATEHIQDQIDLIKRLERKGFIYKTSDGIYFDTSKVSDYGKLAKLDIAGLKAGARVDVKDKKNPTDFALWKFSPKDVKRQMEWDSPWGKGFPGWHIECSAMSMKYLGETFDIHTGGVDHLPVHHTNEIAQSEAATGKTFVNYWLHGEFLNLKDSKMAKSAGGFITMSDLIEKGYEPLAFRYLCLEARYRSKMAFSWESLEAAQKSLNSVRQMAFRQDKKEVSKEIFQKALSSFNDDLDTPGALAILHKENNFNLWLKFEPILALNLKRSPIKLNSEQEKLIQDREKARANKDFKKADQIRQVLEKQGIEIEDTDKGPKVVSK